MNSASEILSRDFGGDIVEPGAAQYPAVSGSLLARGDPALVLRPAQTRDVQAAVRFAAQTGPAQARPAQTRPAQTRPAPSVRGGGHGFAGFGTNDGGVVIDLSRLAAVEVVDSDCGLVRIGGGATWGQVAAALAPHGLAISSGDSKGVGVGGLTLSGGIGWKVRKYGLALDQLTAAEVVTAGGEVVTASAREHPELFWALRGGGGNFGVVTAFEFVAHPTTDVFFGTIAFPASEAATVLAGWVDYLRGAPDELTATAEFANPFAGGPEAPVEIHIAFDGDDPHRAARAIDPIRRLGTASHDDVELVPYPDTLEEAGAPPPAIQIVPRSAFADRASVPEVLSILIEGGMAGLPAAISVRSLGGAVSRVPGHATAFAHRRAELMIMTTSAGPAPVLAAGHPALDALWRRLTPHVSGLYANFLATATAADVAAIYPAETYERLAAVKRRYDPGNLFAANHNVRPQQD